MRNPFDLTAEADELVPQICRFPAISNVTPDTHQTTDKCRRGSAPKSHPYFGTRFGVPETHPLSRSRTGPPRRAQRVSSCGVKQTFSDFGRRCSFDTSVDVGDTL